MTTSGKYDVIVVGCGNAGAVLAARLSEMSALQVLVLEAGADHTGNPMVHVPPGATALLPDTTINWGYETVPKEAYKGIPISHHRGKGLGGTSLVNLNFVAFPSRGSIDNFARQKCRPAPDEARLADYIILYSSLFHPFSRGTVHARSKAISDPPLIDPKDFSNPADREIFARHLLCLPTIYKTQPLAGIIKPNGRTIPVELVIESLECARDMVETGFTTHHPCGSCSMMPREDSEVVDSSLRVCGVKGLRVVDASVFPLIPRWNVQTSVHAVAEKASDMIKAALASPN